MTKLSTLAHTARELLAPLFLIALMTVSAGCGGGSDGPAAAAPPPPPPPAPAAIEGVATPSSVAVVTATNAQ